jgi:3-deoxy-D-manno-octulosonic-acid transferase
MKNSAKPSFSAKDRPQGLPLYWAFLVLLLPLIVLSAVFVSRIRQGLLSRLGLVRHPLPKQGILVVASSVGEVGAGEKLVPYLRRAFPGYYLVLSVFSFSGFNRALRGGLFDSVVITPYDLPPCVRICFWGFTPLALIQIEADIWPTLTLWAREQGACCALASGRMTRGAMLRLLPFKSISGAMYRMMCPLTARFAEDARLMRKLVGRRAEIAPVGNLKYSNMAQVTPKRDEILAKSLGLTGRSPVIVAGSTHREDEKVIFSAYRKLLGNFPTLKLIVAPRYIRRAGRLAEQANKDGFSVALRSQSFENQDWQVLVLDSFGELSRTYGLATIAIVGGGFGRRGGQDIVEPAARGVPVVFGPRVPTFDYEAGRLKGAGGFMVGDEEEMVTVLRSLLSDGGYRKKVAREAWQTALSLSGAGELFLREITQWNLRP